MNRDTWCLCRFFNCDSRTLQAPGILRNWILNEIGISFTMTEQHVASATNPCRGEMSGGQLVTVSNYPEYKAITGNYLQNLPLPTKRALKCNISWAAICSLLCFIRPPSPDLLSMTSPPAHSNDRGRRRSRSRSRDSRRNSRRRDFSRDSNSTLVQENT